MTLKEIQNIKIQHPPYIKIQNTTPTTIKHIQSNYNKTQPFTITLLIDNIQSYHYKIAKITIQKQNLEDKRITLYTTMTQTIMDIIIPANKEVVLIIDNNVW